MCFFKNKVAFEGWSISPNVMVKYGGGWKLTGLVFECKDKFGRSMLLGCYSQAATTKKERMPLFKLVKRKKKTQTHTVV